VQRWQRLSDVPATWPGSTVTIGVFDGVHRGHRVVVAATIEHAHRLGVPAVVVTFDPHPMRVLRPAVAPVLLSTLDQRVSLLGSLGADAVLVLPFSAELAALTPDEFARRVLADRLRARHVVVGDNFRFGNRAAGDTQTLAELGAELGFEVEAMPLESGAGATWSSTYVRGLVAAGDVAAAAESLGRPHRVEGVVVSGNKRGRELGFPTANLATTDHAAVPADGVYAGWVVRRPYTSGQERHPAAISIGTNPQFEGLERRIEAYVLDRDDLDLYGEHLGFDFVARLRDTMRFEAVVGLIVQMGEDVARARDLLTAP
jgi:riboflavin kinase/FMN adenylyltransferase